MQVELLTRVRLDPKQAILCQCEGCNRRVYADVHVLNLDGQVTVFGKKCFTNAFGERQFEETYPWSGETQLTPEQRLLLENNTKEFIERYLKPEPKLSTIETTEPPPEQSYSYIHPAPQPFAYKPREQPLSYEQLNQIEAFYLSKAKDELRRRAGLDPELAGWSGLVKLIALDMQTGVEVDWSWLAVDLSQPKSKQKKADKPASSEVADQALNDMFNMLK